MAWLAQSKEAIARDLEAKERATQYLEAEAAGLRDDAVHREAALEHDIATLQERLASTIAELEAMSCELQEAYASQEHLGQQLTINKVNRQTQTLMMHVFSLSRPCLVAG